MASPHYVHSIFEKAFDAVLFRFHLGFLARCFVSGKSRRIPSNIEDPLNGTRVSFERRYTGAARGCTNDRTPASVTAAPVKVITVVVAFGPHILSTFSEFLSAAVCEKTTGLVEFLYQNPPSLPRREDRLLFKK